MNAPADVFINWNRITLFNFKYHTLLFVFSILCVTCGRVQKCVVGFCVWRLAAVTTVAWLELEHLICVLNYYYYYSMWTQKHSYTNWTGTHLNGLTQSQNELECFNSHIRRWHHKPLSFNENAILCWLIWQDLACAWFWAYTAQYDRKKKCWTMRWINEYYWWWINEQTKSHRENMRVLSNKTYRTFPKLWILLVYLKMPKSAWKIIIYLLNI